MRMVRRKGGREEEDLQKNHTPNRQFWRQRTANLTKLQMDRWNLGAGGGHAKKPHTSDQHPIQAPKSCKFTNLASVELMMMVVVVVVVTTSNSGDCKELRIYYILLLRQWNLEGGGFAETPTHQKPKSGAAELRIRRFWCWMDGR